eukprot:scaffold6691_cov358-Prasinococcus_capsulatus_cf.AAC.4
MRGCRDMTLHAVKLADQAQAGRLTLQVRRVPKEEALARAAENAGTIFDIIDADERCRWRPLARPSLLACVLACRSLHSPLPALAAADGEGGFPMHG